ncbi:PREDICTED: uncharacterized protein LOC109231046 isoform X5 [Nicotiana attenuata]|uniref:uncharacterized protein LOC109231046 isoform X5 n=1 Tax=Nicotiana attenuata TaxID=49451 RepID=UPI0009056BA7|nr:PREDICTED: uncharacterized protein LOC109231046 isoform X5 [Nicotiana attenuata]
MTTGCSDVWLLALKLFAASSICFLLWLRLEEVQRILLDICSKIATYILVAWQALSSVVSSVPKEVLPTYIKLVRDAASTSRDKERRKKKGGPVLIPGFCLPKALQPLLPIFLQALDSYYR